MPATLSIQLCSSLPRCAYNLLLIAWWRRALRYPVHWFIYCHTELYYNATMLRRNLASAKIVKIEYNASLDIIGFPHFITFKECRKVPWSEKNDTEELTNSVYLNIITSSFLVIFPKLFRKELQDLFQFRVEWHTGQPSRAIQCDRRFSLCFAGSTWSEEEPTTDVRGLESRVREQVRKCVALTGTLCARVVPRHRAGTTHIHSTGVQQLVSVCSTRE